MLIQGFRVPVRIKLTEESKNLLYTFRIHHAAYWYASGRDWQRTIRQLVVLSASNAYRVVYIEGTHFKQFETTAEVVDSLEGGRFCILQV